MHRASSKLDKNLSYLLKSKVLLFLGLPWSDKALVIKNPSVNGGDAKELIEEGLIPGSGRSLM